jgi:competence protein ComEC
MNSTTPTDSSTSGESDFGPFVASKDKRLFHRASCEWMQRVRSENLIEFGTHKEAVESGLKPCKTCRA